MIAWWPGDSNAKEIKNNNDGALQGNASFAPGMVGDAFHFELNPTVKVKGFVTVSDHPTLAVRKAITIDAWINPTANLDSALTIVSKRGSDATGTTGYILQAISGRSIIHFSIVLEVSRVVDLQAGYHPGKWTHVAAVFDGRELRIYVDSRLGAARFVGPDQIAEASGELNIGKNIFSSDAPDNFDGQIDELELFDRALSEEEIRAIYGAGPAGKCKEDITKVEIDIKPGSFPNSINLSNAGVVPVAVFSSPTFDATQIDPASVSLAGASVKMVGKSGKYLCSTDDVNKDGLPDLVCQVWTAQFMIEVGDSVAVFEALTFGGKRVRGEDSIRIVPD
jgi:hypothetical protein